MLRSSDLTTDILRLRWLIAAEQFQLCFARSVPPTEELQLKCRQLEWSLAAHRFQLAYARHVQALIKAGFNPDQPRNPNVPVIELHVLRGVSLRHRLPFTGSRICQTTLRW